jgi:CRISPR/Cas system-associated exonuclease Cas4 (RecB family)
LSDKRRNPPTVWAKALGKLLGGDDRCWYKTWYQSNHWTPREELAKEDRERLDEIQKKHDAIVARRADALRAEGFVVRLEDDAAFKIVGDRADLTGKPDLVALRTGDRLVTDGKSGKRREGDVWQVLIYMFALPLSWLGAGKVRGEIEYGDGTVPVRELTRADVEAIGDGVRRLASPEVPPMTPSKWECEYCHIAGCPKRWNSAEHTGSTGLF